jgi:hypothetical protein
LLEHGLGTRAVGQLVSTVTHLCGFDTHLSQPLVDNVYMLLLDSDLVLSD